MRSSHSGWFIADDEIGRGQIPRRTKGGSPGDGRRCAEDHRRHADRQKSEFVIPTACVQLAVRIRGRSSAVRGVAIRLDSVPARLDGATIRLDVVTVRLDSRVGSNQLESAGMGGRVRSRRGASIVIVTPDTAAQKAWCRSFT